MDQRDREAALIAEDVKTLHRLGYAQELLRRMNGFSNFAISLSIICILAGGITSFHVGFCSVGGAAIGLGWPLVCLFSLAVAATMGQVASAYPTAGGLYHWASILGGKGWGWATAWFNLAGLVAVLAGINVGTFLFVLGTVGPALGYHPETLDEQTKASLQLATVVAITFSQGLFNHLGIRVTTLLTDFSGYWIVFVAVALTAAFLWYAPAYDPARLVTFTNYSGPAGHDVWPPTSNLLWLFALGFLLPAYTITGFDASAHTAEETVRAAANVPRGIMRSVLVSGVFGWVMLSALVLAIPDMDRAAAQGDNIFYWILYIALPSDVAVTLALGIGVAQYLCGLATVTSASRMTYAFARDGGLPFSRGLRYVSPRFRTPPLAVWTVSVAAVLFTVSTRVYTTITVVATLFLYVSYVLPTALGLLAHGRTWTQMGPWHLGPFYRPLAALCVAGCGLLIAIGMAPPNDLAVWILAGSVVLMKGVWYGFERRRFQGPPVGHMVEKRQAMIRTAERAVGQTDAG
jgi:amino acid transporter